MKKKIISTFLILSVLVLPTATSAVERTGEILRELLRGVEKDLDTMKEETHGFTQRAETLSKDLQRKADLHDRTEDPARKQTLTADILFLGAELNELDRKEVAATLKTIGRVREKLHRIKDTLHRRRLLPTRKQLPAMRQNMGRLLTTAAQFLERLEKSQLKRKFILQVQDTCLFID